jgi:hypothetical protein
MEEPSPLVITLQRFNDSLREEIRAADMALERLQL